MEMTQLATSPAKEISMSTDQQHTGGCHCGAVRFRVTLDLAEPAARCNCTVCTKIAGTGRIVKPEAFELLAGAGDLSSYRWGGMTATRYFCKHCGIHVYGPGNLPELGGDYVSVNLNCLDGFDPHAVTVIYFDGRHDNWDAGPRPTPWPVKAPGDA